MKLYNIKTEQEEYLDYFQDGESIFYTKFLTRADLKKRGYLMIEESEMPDNVDEFKKIVPKIEIKKDVCYKTYDIVSRDLAELTVMFKKRVQSMMDEAAKKHGYESILSACSYAGYDNPFRKESEKFGIWRANTWKWGYALLEKIKEGKHKMPTSFEELLVEMPKLEI
nr:MAG TPA: hypothetical protein [Bacteriophage sp.]